MNSYNRPFMRTWIKLLLITLIVGIPAFILGPIIWTPSPDIKPTPVQLPFFMFLSLIESLLFGFGIAAMIYGWEFVRNAPAQAKSKTFAAFISLSWLLISWWPHDNAHIHNGMDALGLLYIDYIFHMTLMIASLVLVYYIYSTIKG